MDCVIEVKGVTKRFKEYKALDNVTLNFERGKIHKKEIRQVLKRVGLDPDSKKHVGKYSMGMRQRLGIAQAIMEEPHLLILDEPMNGLDNHGVKEVRELLLKLKEEGKTILLASHNREDISVLCDTVAEIDKGKIISRGGMK